jgi:uncharacterized repeat protein (TIGR02543 family)
MIRPLKRLIALFFFIAVLFSLTTCQKETVVPPVVKLYEGAILINVNKASVTAEVTDQGGAEVKSRGIAYGESGGAMDTVYCGSGVGGFSADLNNLRPNTMYVYEAFAKNAGGFGTSGKVTFTTLDNLVPTVKTGEVRDVEATAATCGGNVTDDGGASVTERGVCWSVSHSPTVSGSHASAGEGLGEYTCEMTGLTANTTYYVRAYARNSKGVAYGEEKDFVTLEGVLAVVATDDVTDITQTTAKCGGEVSDDGGTAVTERGVVWSSSHNPTIANHKVSAGEGMGTFTCDITGLSVHTKYYVRAYAINSKGTAYGDEVSFTTLAADPVLPVVSTGSVTGITAGSARGSGNVTDAGGAIITERGLCWSTDHNPTVNGHKVTAGTGVGEFTATMSSLTANTRYYMKAYAVNSVGTSYGEEVAFTTLEQGQDYVVSVSSSPSNGGTATGGGTYQQGQSCTVRAVANSGYTFTNWTESGEEVSTQANYTFTVNGNRTLVAHFAAEAPNTYTVSVSASPSSGGTVSGGGTFAQGQSCTVRATAASGYTFQKWTENGSQVSTNATYTFTVTGNRSLVAHFVETPNSYTISAGVTPTGAGTVTGAGTYQQGQSCTLRATAGTGYSFQKWTKNGTQVSTNATYTFTVTESASYVAHFQLQSYTISTSSNPSAGGTTTGGGTYNYGQNCTLRATANNGYTFLKWTRNGTQVSTNATYTFPVTASGSYVAHFDEHTYNINVSASPSNGGTVSGGGVHYYNQSCTVHAVANSGYTFTNWTENGSQVSTNANYTFTVTGNRTLVAHFTQQSQAPTGAINGVFSVSASQRVYFSQGNLQYKASNGTWRFATNQYDYIGSANSNISSSYSGYIDLFGWGTSGWNCGNTYYRPWDSNNSDGSLYGPPGSYNLTGSYANSDWGRYNAISNGGNQTNQWRTLSNDEWGYVFNTRSTSSGIRYAKAQVNNVNGVILLPDNWSSSYYTLYSTNQSGASFSSNVISSSTWTSSLQSHGAVFLPAAGGRSGTLVQYLGSFGGYWSASYLTSVNAQVVAFDDTNLYTIYTASDRHIGTSVRLVCPAE